MLDALQALAANSSDRDGIFDEVKVAFMNRRLGFTSAPWRDLRGEFP